MRPDGPRLPRGMVKLVRGRKSLVLARPDVPAILLATLLCLGATATDTGSVGTRSDGPSGL